MNVNNRKLFANRDARRRLADMGGIVASSPELLGAAQQFQVGGEARFMNPNDRLNTLMTSPYVLQQAEMLNMTPQDYVGGLTPARSTQLIEASLANQRDLAAMPEPTPQPTPEPEPVVLNPDVPLPPPESMAREEEAQRALDVAGTFEEQAEQDDVTRLAQEIETSDDPVTTASSRVIEMAGMDPASSAEERIRQYEEIFTRMFGQDEETKRRERYMNLAMIGFAIAAGEDPSALKNIADGMLRGTEAGIENQRRQEARMDAARTAAVQAGLQDVRDERAAARAASAADLANQRAIDMFNMETARRTAEADKEFEREIQLAYLEAAAGDPDYRNPLHPAEQYNRAFEAELERIGGLVESYAEEYRGMSDAEQRELARRNAVESTQDYLRRLQNPEDPGSGIGDLGLLQTLTAEQLQQLAEVDPDYRETLLRSFTE